MYHVSLTRLRIRSWRFMPLFVIDALRSNSQVRRAAGFHRGALLPDRELTFWTMTVWDSRQSMLAYMTSGAHKKAMPNLMHWCDEASVAHWDQASEEPPSWEDADQRMRSTGRASKVNHPSPQHATLTYRAPRTSRSSQIRRG